MASVVFGISLFSSKEVEKDIHVSALVLVAQGELEYNASLGNYKGEERLPDNHHVQHRNFCCRSPRFKCLLHAVGSKLHCWEALSIVFDAVETFAWYLGYLGPHRKLPGPIQTQTLSLLHFIIGRGVRRVFARGGSYRGREAVLDRVLVGAVLLPMVAILHGPSDLL